jgi:hypothetical protein
VDAPDNMTSCVMPTVVPLGAVFQNCCLNHTIGIIAAYGDDNCLSYCNYTTPVDEEEQEKQFRTFNTCFRAGSAKMNYTIQDSTQCFGAKTFYGDKSESRMNRGSIMSILLFCSVGLSFTFAL